jgi:uncharacterized delta-60 repeat protein
MRGVLAGLVVSLILLAGCGSGASRQLGQPIQILGEKAFDHAFAGVGPTAQADAARLSTSVAGRRLLSGPLSSLQGRGGLLAHAGSLDTSFGRGGRVMTSFTGRFGDEAYAVAIQRDGKILVSGRGDGSAHYSFVLARYNANGSLDPSFGKGGKVRTAFAGKFDVEAYALAIQRDGKIVAAGLRREGGRRAAFALVRYTTNGSLDTSFGKRGRVTTAFAAKSDDEAYAVASQADGKIIAAGLHKVGRHSEFALARYNTNGSLDRSFGKGGEVTTAFAGRRAEEAHALAIQRDGKIVATGGGPPYSAFALARYNANGSLDPSFGEDGRVTTAVGSMSVADALGVESDAKIVAAGENMSGFALARYRTNGSLDTSFGKGGKVTTVFGGLAGATGLATQPNGKLVVGGSGPFNTSGFLLVRYNANGSLDPSFGSGGKATTSFPSSSEDDLSAVALQSDGKIVAAGATNPNDNGYDFALARYLG